MPTRKTRGKTLSQRETTLHETDLAAERMGRNSLQGDDQANVRNQRHAQPGELPEPDESVLESFEKMDKETRARTDLGKGNRSGK